MTETQRLKRNAYMRGWNSRHRERVRAGKRTEKALQAGAARSREYRAKMSVEEKARFEEYKRRWVEAQSEEWQQKQRDRLRENARKKRATREGAERLTDAVRRYRDRNRDRINAEARERRRNATLEQRKKKNEADRRYRLKWTPEQRDADRERHRQRRRENRDRHNANNQRRRALKKGNGGVYTATEWQTVKTQSDHRCLCCGRQEPEIKLTPDHVIPISKGGINTIENIQPLCYSCNASKQARTIDYRPRAVISQSG